MTPSTSIHIFHKTKVKAVCVLILLCIPLAMMDIPGPCKHSVTKDHLLQIRHLISNQLQKGCSITYAFIERRNLSDVCYVKAALPHVLELLQVQFQYARGSDSALMVLSLQRLILNIYSQHCVPDLNEELEEDPVAFERQYVSSPVRALRRVEEVLSLYLQLITQTHTPLDWNCEKEYSSQTPGVPTHRPSSTEQAAGLLGQDPQRAPSEKAYRLGLIILAVCGALFLIIIVLCFLERKKLLDQLNRSRMSLDWRLNTESEPSEVPEQSSLSSDQV